MTTTDARASAGGIAGGNGLTPAARTSARARLSAMEMSDEFDSLTELFLGEVGASPAATRRMTTAQSPDTSERASVGAEVPAADPTSFSHDSADGTTSTPSAALIEALVIGHVPVLASAWASQYVREVVRAGGRPAAFLRIHDDHASLDIVFPVDWNGVPPEQSASVHDAVRDAALITSRWIVQTDAIGEAELAADPSVSLITLLTGADEAARVAGYGAVKRLSEHLPPVDPSGESRGTHIRVATVGVAPEIAGAAGQKIVEAVRHFLGRDAQQATCSPKIRAGRASCLAFSGPIDISACELVHRITAHVAGEASTPVVAKEPERSFVKEVPEPRPEVIEPDVAEHAESIELAAEFLARSESTASIRTSINVPPEPAAPALPESRSEPAVEVTPVAHQPINTPPAPRVQSVPHTTTDLRSALCENIEGLVRLRACCPVATGVELALDSDGQLHVIADGRGGEWRVNGAIADAMVAASWLAAHVDLVAPLAASLRGARRTTLHVMVDQPRQARRLLDSGVKFHLLAEVRVGDSAALYCTDLN